jgi:hypothetical protein
VIFALLAAFLSMSVAQRPASIPMYVVIAAVLAFMLLRYGPVALAVTQGTFFAMLRAPLFPGPSWAMGLAIVTLIAVIVPAVWAFRTSLGGQPAFSASLLDE